MGLRKKAVLAFVIVIVLLATVYCLVFLPARPAETYAKEKGLSNGIIEKLKVFDSDQMLNQSEVVFIDYVSDLDKSLQQKVVDGFLSDGKLSTDEVHQIEFLKQFPKIEQVKFIESGKFADFDWDKDFLDNWFEVQKTKTDYLIPNDRYVIWLSTTNPKDFASGPNALLLGNTPKEEVQKFLTEWERIPQKNLILLEYKEATPSSLRSAISDIANRADKNDFVYVMLESHGNVNIIALYNDNSSSTLDYILSYQELDSWLDEIRTAKVVTVVIGACDSASARESLKEGPSPRIVAPMFDLNRLIRRYIPEWRKIYEENYGVPSQDDDGYVSIGEATRDEKIEYKGSSDYDIADTHGLAFDTFLGDCIIGEKDYRK